MAQQPAYDFTQYIEISNLEGGSYCDETQAFYTFDYLYYSFSHNIDVYIVRTIEAYDDYNNQSLIGSQTPGNHISMYEWDTRTPISYPAGSGQSGPAFSSLPFAAESGVSLPRNARFYIVTYRYTYSYNGENVLEWQYRVACNMKSNTTYEESFEVISAPCWFLP